MMYVQYVLYVFILCKSDAECTPLEKMLSNMLACTILPLQLKWSTNESVLPATVVCKIPDTENLKLLSDISPQMAEMEAEMKKLLPDVSCRLGLQRL